MIKGLLPRPSLAACFYVTDLSLPTSHDVELVFTPFTYDDT